ncbi:MAG: citrate transporter [Spirochaetaceae bacterium]|jgi:Na+/H+ antiporter NhaD/arsenite permease-like protein|nr:citrate transporter [Spirochaetaceae bacterium]
MDMKWIVLTIAVLMYAVVIMFPQRKAWATLVAAVLVVVLGAVTPVQALGELINWHVLMIYVGSLAIAELFIYSRVPARIADGIVEKAPNVGIAIVAILMMTGIISAFVENVATVLVMAPIALALSRKLKMNPTYFMVGLAVMANLQGTATLVGDPPSMIFASYANYGFNDFFVYAGRPSIFFVVQVGMIAGALYFYAYFAKQGAKKVSVEKETILSLVPSILLILMIAGLAVCSFFFGGVSMISGLLVLGLGIAGVLWYRFIRKESTADTVKLVKGLDWETILFLIGIFVVVGAIAETGLLMDFSAVLASFIGGNVLLGFVVILAVSVIISGFVDNVPYIIVMLPVAASIAEGMGLRPELYLFALLIGSCLGGNLTPFGASANVVAVGILKKEGVTLTFPGWLKIGLPFTVITTVAASVFLWFVWK